MSIHAYQRWIYAISVVIAAFLVSAAQSLVASNPANSAHLVSDSSHTAPGGFNLPPTSSRRLQRIAQAATDSTALRGSTRPAKARSGTTIVAKTTPSKKNVARKASLVADRSKTTFQLELSRGVPAEVFTLANPYRVVIDLPDVVFALPTDAGRHGRGLVSEFRFGLFAARKARVVLDTVSPVRIDKAEMRAIASGGVMLELTLVRTDRKSFGVGTGAARSGPKVKRSDPGKHQQAKKHKNKKSAKKKARNAKPVVVIDAGHGGIDPGALGKGNVYEKSIVLAVAKKLKNKLAGTGRYKVYLTRSSDIFVSLDRRVEQSNNRGADIFVSLHADSISDTRFANTVTGATVYTLSERASDEQSRLMAEKENSVDALAGLDNSKTNKAVEVRNILIDLLKRETANFSTDLSNAIVQKLKRTVALSRKPRRSADFKVLRQTRTPSVLIELGYMSNERDVKTMSGKQWQASAAGAIANAIDHYFTRRSRQAR